MICLLALENRGDSVDLCAEVMLKYGDPLGVASAFGALESLEFILRV